MPKFSIILPLRDSGNYLDECIKSILNQTYKDFDLLVLAHDSNPETLSYLRSIKDARAKIIYAENVDGITGNWARIKDIPKSEYMTIIGYDDVLKPNFLKVINELIEKYPEASLYHTHFQFIDSHGKVVRNCKQMLQKLIGYDLLKYFLNGTIDSMGTGYVMRSKDYDRIGGIPTHYPNLLFADFDLWIRLTRISFEVISQEDCFSFRVHQSVTSSSPDTRLHRGLSTFVDFLVELKEHDEVYSEVIQKNGAEFLTRYAKSYSDRILRTPKKQRGEISVSNYINQTVEFAKKMGVDSQFHPEKERSIRLSKIIDENILLSSIFLFLRARYGRAFRK